MSSGAESLGSRGSASASSFIRNVDFAKGLGASTAPTFDAIKAFKEFSSLNASVSTGKFIGDRWKAGDFQFKPITSGSASASSFIRNVDFAKGLGASTAGNDARSLLATEPVLDPPDAAGLGWSVAEQLASWAQCLPNREARAVILNLGGAIVGVTGAILAADQGTEVAFVALLWALFYLIALANSVVDKITK